MLQARQSIDTIKIKMFDGTVRKLNEVRHVPKLRKNLISISCLDAISCKITLSDEVMKIEKGSW